MSLTINYTTGYAGTGKSHRLIELVHTLPLDTTIVIAPTHKALERLREHIPPKMEIKTIHSLLGWIPTINENATKVEHIDATHKLDKELDEYSHIVIDEAGMMSEEMFFDIISKLETKIFEAEEQGLEIPKIVIECFLDPYQLLPVRGQQIQTDPLTTTHLTKQYRAESPDIVKLYTKFVKYIEGENITDLTTPYSENVLKFDLSKFKPGDRALAYTNKRVGELNQVIAKHLGINSYEGQEVQLGSMLELVKCDEFIHPSLNDLLLAYETGTLNLQNAQISKRFIESSLKALIDHKDIQFITDHTYIYPVIVGIGKANIILKEAKKKAVENKKYFKWVYALGRAYTMDYGFATTVHKAQGSEFENVFIDKKDIQKSIIHNYYMTYARLMYVAISRAKNKIYI